MYYIFMSEEAVRNNWGIIQIDHDNPRPDLKTPDEWLAVAKRGELKTLGATIVIQNTFPKIGDL